MTESNETGDRDQDLQDAFLVFVKDIAATARKRESLRALLHSAARWLIEETRPASFTAAADQSSGAPTESDRTLDRALTQSVELVERTLEIGGNKAPLRVARDHSPNLVEPVATRRPTESDADADGIVRGANWRVAQYADFDVIIERSRLKAEACRWKIEHRRLELEGGDESDMEIAYDELIERAKQFDSCFLWMVQWYTLPDDTVMEHIAEAYENLALMAEVCYEWTGLNAEGTRPPRDMLQLAAETQSALRKALLDASFQDDRDQNDMFFWLREQAEQHRIYIERHLRKDDLAEPANWRDLRARIEGYGLSIRRERHNEQKRNALLKRIEYHVEQLEDDRFGQASHHWAKIIDSLNEWVESGFYASDPDLCDVLADVIDDLPEDQEISGRAGEVLRYAETYAESLDDDDDTEEADDDDEDDLERSAEAEQVAEMLRDKVVVLVGGDLRVHAKRRLERDFELRELRWIATRPHQSLSTMEPHVADPDVAVVLLMIRLSSHMHGELDELCQRHGKPFVRLAAGYGTNQVAHQILQQASRRLEPAN